MIDALTRAVEQELGTKVRGVGRLAQAGVNEVYRVRTVDAPLVVKVFRYAGWPEADKLPWVERQLAAYDVNYAPTLYYSRAAKYFPHGLSISTELAGENADEALRAGRLAPFEFATKFGALLRQLHCIPVARYGYVRGGAGMYESFVEFKLTHEVGERFAALPADVVPDGWHERVVALVERQLAPLAVRLRPVLAHDDAKPDNVIWTNAGTPVLIDWDEAIGGTWLSDYTRLTYWLDYSPALVFTAAERQAFRAAFFAGYGAVEFDAAEVAAAEHALHVIHSVDLLPFHHARQNLSAVAQLRARLVRLLG